MHRAIRVATVGLGVLLAACVTIHIYFPAAAAEQAADQVIREVWGERPPAQRPSPPAPAEAPPTSLERHSPSVWVLALADLVVAPAAAEANVDVSTPTVRALTASMQARHGQLQPHYGSGAVGLGADGRLVLRDAAAVPIAQRRAVSQLVAEENRDRDALYREVAVANGHPEWEGQVRETFARRWVANARPGWWYQGAGGQWARK
jgi:uncharacterized protein YdbL (DUF1318 family)